MSNHMSKWPKNIRETGLVERVCPHGIGHPDPDWLKGRPSHWGVHGCDGCCSTPSPNGPEQDGDYASWIRMFENMAERVRAGELPAAVLHDFGLMPEPAPAADGRGTPLLLDRLLRNFITLIHLPLPPAQEGKDQHGPDWLSDDQLADIDKLSAATSVPDSESAKAGLTSRVSDDGYHVAKVATDPAADPTTDELVMEANRVIGTYYWLPKRNTMVSIIERLRDRVVEQGRELEWANNRIGEYADKYGDVI